MNNLNFRIKFNFFWFVINFSNFITAICLEAPPLLSVFIALVCLYSLHMTFRLIEAKKLLGDNKNAQQDEKR